MGPFPPVTDERIKLCHFTIAVALAAVRFLLLDFLVGGAVVDVVVVAVVVAVVVVAGTMR